LDLCKLPELHIVAVWAVKLNLFSDLMSPNQPQRSWDRTCYSSLLNICDCQMDTRPMALLTICCVCSKHRKAG